MAKNIPQKLFYYIFLILLFTSTIVTTFNLTRAIFVLYIWRLVHSFQLLSKGSCLLLVLYHEVFETRKPYSMTSAILCINKWRIKLQFFFLSEFMQIYLQCFFFIYEVNILLAFSRWCVFLYFPVIFNCSEKINDDTICTGCLLPILLTVIIFNPLIMLLFNLWFLVL